MGNKETPKANPDNQNKNLVELPADFTVEGKKVLKVLNALIGEEETSYKVILEDGTQAVIPASSLN